MFKVQTLHLSLPVVVQFLYGIIAVTEGGDRVRLDYSWLDDRIEVKKAAGSLNVINGVRNSIYVK